MEKISDGTMHAVSIKAYTPEQWVRDRKLMMLQEASMDQFVIQGGSTIAGEVTISGAKNAALPI